MIEFNIEIANGISENNKYFIIFYRIFCEPDSMSCTPSVILGYKSATQARISSQYIILNFITQITNNKNVFFNAFIQQCIDY